MTNPNPEEPLTLTLELAGNTPSVALALGNQYLGLEPVEDSSTHHDDLMPAINRLFQLHNKKPSRLNEIYLSIGPGGFTGLRKSVTTAKMLALTTNANILPIPTAEILAQAVPCPSPNDKTTDLPSTLIVSLAYKRGQSWCTTFHPKTEDSENPASPSHWSPKHHSSFEEIIPLCNTFNQPVLLTGDIPEDTLQKLQILTTIHYHNPEYSAKYAWQVGRRHRYQITLGSESWGDPAQLAPFYGREPEAVRLWKSRTKSD